MDDVLANDAGSNISDGENEQIDITSEEILSVSAQIPDGILTVSSVDNQEAVPVVPDSLELAESGVSSNNILDFCIDRTAIHLQEKLYNAEFFTMLTSGQKARKTPDRYVKIRNHILDLWAAKQPRYVSKSAIRPGLKDCGDVHAISRVHSFLEAVGAINTNHTKAAQARESFLSDLDSISRDQRSPKAHTEITPISRQQRIIKPPTLQKRLTEEPILSKKKRRRKNNMQEYESSSEIHDHSQFELVEPRSFDHDKEQQPFTVAIDDYSMIVMDLHAHLEEIEVIGLLGGHFDEEQRSLTISLAFPCKSASTSMQCEMDPYSEIEARQLFAQEGLVSVGWYHSHPVFDPIPSVRDIETQSTYQTLFCTSGGIEPFVGVIVSPFNPTNPSPLSQVVFTVVQGSIDNRVPFACTVERYKSTSSIERLEAQVQGLLTKYKENHRCRDMSLNRTYGGDMQLSHQAKLICSLQSHAMHVNSSIQTILRLLEQQL